MIAKSISVISFLLFIVSPAKCDSCDIGEIFKGMVKIDIVQHRDKGPGGEQIVWETGIVSTAGDGPERILAKIDEPERDGSMAVTDSQGRACGRVIISDDQGNRLSNPELSCDPQYEGCAALNSSIYLRKAGPKAFVAMLKGDVVWGTIEGRFPDR